MDDKRTAILNVAIELFVAKGFHGTPTSLIAKRADISNGTLFHYFNTKEELINAIYLETKDKLFLFITEEFNKEDELVNRIQYLWSRSIQWGLLNPSSFRFIQQYNNSPFISKLTSEQVSRHQNFFVALLEEGQKKGIIKNMDVQLLLQISLWHIYGLIFFLLERKEQQHDNKILSEAYKSYWVSITS